MRTLEGIDTIYQRPEIPYHFGLEDMRTLEGIDTLFNSIACSCMITMLEDMRTLEWENCQANPVYIYEE